MSDVMNFNIAFGITRYDGNKESIEDPDYGTMKAYYRHWGIVDNLAVYVDEVPTRPCTYADFGLDEDGELIQEAENLTEFDGLAED